MRELRFEPVGVRLAVILTTYHLFSIKRNTRVGFRFLLGGFGFASIFFIIVLVFNFVMYFASDDTADPFTQAETIPVHPDFLSE